MTQFIIPADALADFSAKIAKLNRRAARLGCEPITVTVVGKTTVERQHTSKTSDGERTRSYKIAATVIELVGAAPKLEGFEFIAKIEYLSDRASMLFHTVPGTEVAIDPRFRSMRPSTCEHCNKVRRRSETFVVRNIETGAQTQVGRQCLADFTGINDPERIASRASWLSSFSDLRETEGGYWGTHFGQTIDTAYALALTSAYIATEGWCPRSAETGTPTAGRVGRHFWGWDGETAAARQRMKDMAALAESAEHQDRAARVIAWLKTLEGNERSDYERNLVTLTMNDLAEAKHLGIICSAVAAYQRAMNQQVEYARKQEALKDSQHIGDVGERLRNLSVKIEKVRALGDNGFGPRTLITFVTLGGNLLTWFASGDRDYKPGTDAVITGTVKKHDEFRGIKQTLLSRVVIA